MTGEASRILAAMRGTTAGTTEPDPPPLPDHARTAFELGGWSALAKLSFSYGATYACPSPRNHFPRHTTCGCGGYGVVVVSRRQPGLFRKGGTPLLAAVLAETHPITLDQALSVLEKTGQDLKQAEAWLRLSIAAGLGP